MPETRTFPTCCTSALCGRIECGGCPNKPALDAFKAWKVETNATVADPIWSRNVWVATIAEPRKATS
jgi:hypothetical protein